jgi:hypothetical protein
MTRPIVPVCGYPNVLADSTTVNDPRFGLLKEVKSEDYATEPEEIKTWLCGQE